MKTPVNYGNCPVCVGAVIALSLVLVCLAGAAPVTAGSPAPESAPDPAEPSVQGAQPFLTLLCEFSDVPGQLRPPRSFEELVGDAYPGLVDYWAEVSYGQIDLHGSRVAGWYVLPHPSGAYRVDTRFGFDLDRLAADCAAAADPDTDFAPFRGINFVFNQGWATAAGKHTCLKLNGADRCLGATWLFGSRASSQSIIAHEMGHAFGLPHSSAGDAQEYGNVWDIMSTCDAPPADAVLGAVAQHPIAYHKDRLGWIPAHRKFTAPAAGVTTITLDQLARPQTAAYLVAVIPINGSPDHFYTVEARRPVGYDRGLPGDAVVIHEVDTGRAVPAHLVNHKNDGDTRVSAGMWTPGMLFVDADRDIAVAVERGTATGFVVTIYTGARPWPRAPVNGEDLADGPVELSWQPVTGAAGYQLQIMPVQDAAQGMTNGFREVSASTATVTLPKGDYAWRVRALPDGPWSPEYRFHVGREAARWLPGEEVARLALPACSRPALSAGEDGIVRVAWAEAASAPLPVVFRMADHVGGAWRSVELAGAVGLNPTLVLGAGGKVCAAWGELRKLAFSGPTIVSVEGNASIWGGCWGTSDPGMEAVANRIDSSAPDAWRVRPVVTSDPAGSLYAAWEEIGADGDADIYFAVRSASGAWSAARQVNGDLPRGPQWNAAIAVDGRNSVYVVWADARVGPSEIYVAAKLAGAEWEDNVRISLDDGSSKMRPAIAVDRQGNAYAAWQSYGASDGLAAVRSIRFALRPQGGSWSAPATVRADIGGTREELAAPAVVATPDGGIYLAWEELVAGKFTLYSGYRTPDGRWEAPTPIPDGAGNVSSTLPVLAAAEQGNVYLAWIDTRGGEGLLRVARAHK